MKREIGAMLLLFLLAAVAVWNIHRTDALTAELEEHLELSEKALLSGDRDYAAEQLEAARRIWLSARNYTRVFLCHPSLDAASVVFYEIMQDLRAGETRGLSASFERLRYHLDSIAEMEHVSLGSIF